MQTIPINVDVNAQLKSFQDSDVLYVTSIFYTIQGEGLYAGCPCIFIRLAGCNYGSKTNVCTQCDTAFQLKNAKTYSVAELMREVEAIAKANQCYSLVITGGEPTLQPLIKSFLKSWINAFLRTPLPGKFIQIETNGSVPSFYEDDAWEVLQGRVTIVCSPKVNEVSGKYLRIAQSVVKRVHAFKFLISADPDSAYHNVPTLSDLMNTYGAAASIKDYYLSPISVYKKAPDGEVACVFDTDIIDQEATRKNYAYAAQYVLQHPFYKLSLQTHLFTAVP